MSACYVVLQRALQLVVLRLRSREFKELEIVVLRHEMAILRRHTCRPSMRTADRVQVAGSTIHEALTPLATRGAENARASRLTWPRY